MQIKVRNEVGQPTCVWLVDPSQGESGETVETWYISEGQEVTLTLPDVHSADGVQAAEPVDSPSTEGAEDANGGTLDPDAEEAEDQGGGETAAAQSGDDAVSDGEDGEKADPAEGQETSG